MHQSDPNRSLCANYVTAQNKLSVELLEYPYGRNSKSYGIYFYYLRGTYKSTIIPYEKLKVLFDNKYFYENRWQNYSDGTHNVDYMIKRGNDRTLPVSKRWWITLSVKNANGVGNVETHKCDECVPGHNWNL